MGIFTYDPKDIRKDFPILDNPKKKIIYFDNACMSLRPRQVIDALNRYYIEFPGCGELPTRKRVFLWP